MPGATEAAVFYISNDFDRSWHGDILQTFNGFRLGFDP